MTYKQSLIEAICKHPSVSLALAFPRANTPALSALVSLRKARRDCKRQIKNAKEESGVRHEGVMTGPVSWPSDRLLFEAAHTTGLPYDLKELVILALNQKA